MSVRTLVPPQRQAPNAGPLTGPGDHPGPIDGPTPHSDPCAAAESASHAAGRPLPSVVLRSTGIPAADRFDYWRDLMSSTHAPMDLRSDDACDFRARQRVIELGDVTVWPAAFPPVVFRRTAQHIRQADPENYHVSLLLRGEGHIFWGRQEVSRYPFSYHTNDTSRPYEIVSGKQRILLIGVEVPKAVLPLPRHRAERAIGLPMSGREGMGALLAQFLTQFTRNLNDYRLSDAPRLGVVLTDLVAAMFAHALESENLLPPDTRQRALVLRIKAFIQQHLADPHLTPTHIAAAHHISVGHLHRLFRTEGTTVAALIRRSRLENARADLADPICAGQPVHTIGARWGMPQASEFSRAFRAAYGVPPRDYRHNTLGAPGAFLSSDGEAPTGT